MRILVKILTAVLLHFFLLTAPSTADIISLKLYSDNRSMIFFSEFEFSHAGYISFNISSLTVTSSSSSSSRPDPSRIGFLLQSREVQNQHRFEFQQNTICPLDFISNSAVFTFQVLTPFNKSYPVTYPGMNSLFFVNCNSESLVTTEGRAELYNTDDDGTTRNYLSAGLTQLPLLYFFLSFVYLGFLVFWINSHPCIHGIHLLMGGLLLMNFVHLLCAAADLYYVKVTGTPHGFDGLFYIFQLIRNVLLFTVIALIGTGWCFWKPSLEEKEIALLILVILLQVWANVDSLLVWKFAGPYNIYREHWTLASIGLDIICCFVIFVPMMWSFISFNKNRETDRNAALNLVNLCLFGFVVFVYVFFTRFLVRGLFSTWVNYGVQEISILVVCMVIFHIFRRDDDKRAVEMACWNSSIQVGNLMKLG